MMKGKYPLSRAKLNQVLLELLAHPEVKLTFSTMLAQQGLSNWFDVHPPTNIDIKIDANQQTGVMDHISTVIHELLHVLFCTMFLGWVDEDLEEVAILAYDADILAYVRKSPKRLHRWEEAINAKLAAMIQKEKLHEV